MKLLSCPRILPVLGLIAVLAGCTSLTLYRDGLQPCKAPLPERACPAAAIQERADPSDPAGDYLLGFIEFDDQGMPHRRAQANAVLDALWARAASEDLLIVVYVHGWKHNAAEGDDNVRHFRALLSALGQLEAEVSKSADRTRRRIAGVYLGWRGLSLDAGLLTNLSFWDRKNTAHRVGAGGVSEILVRLEQVRNVRNKVDRAHDNGASRLVIVGHSFGGAVVYTALAEILVERFVVTTGATGVVRDAAGVGDLVVLLNPAFEANRFAPLQAMAVERRSYFDSQLPVLAILTSEADDATGRAFPLGRSFSTLFETYSSPEQGTGDRTAVGHYKPFWTHWLEADSSEGGNSAADFRLQRAIEQAWDEDRPGHVMKFPGSRLTRLPGSAARNPYLVVRVDGELIAGHNEIYDPRVWNFLRHFILLSAQDTTAEQRVLRKAVRPGAAPRTGDQRVPEQN